MTRGDKGIDPLDNAGKELILLILPSPHKVDKILEHKAWERVKSKDVKYYEKAAVWLVTKVMKAKRKLGKGISFRNGIERPARNGLRKIQNSKAQC